MVEIKTTAEMLDRVERMGMCDAIGDGVAYLFSSNVAESILDGEQDASDLSAIHGILTSSIDVKGSVVRGVTSIYHHSTLIRMHL